jgi:hypothetical protein
MAQAYTPYERIFSVEWQRYMHPIQPPWLRWENGFKRL